MADATVDLSKPCTISITREFDAPRELVWTAITDPAHVDVWWGPDGFKNITQKNDLRVGGSWIFVMRSPDGHDFPNAITYRELVPPERLAYRQGTSEEENPEQDFNAVITLEDLAGKTRLTLTMTFASQEALDLVIRDYGAVEGGIQHLEKLSDHLERMRVR